MTEAQAKIPARDFGRIGFTEEQADLLDGAARFCADKSPIEKVRKLIGEECGFDQSVWEENVALGWLGVAIPEEYGGVGLSMAEVAPIAEQMGAAMMATPFSATTIAAQLVLTAGGEEQKKEILPAIVAGAPVALAFMEDEGGWDLTQISSVAQSGALRGRKVLVEHADVARWVLVSVLRNGKPALALLERGDIPDSALRRETVIDETKRCYALTLDGVTVSESEFLDQNRTGPALARMALAASLLSAAECVGAAKAVIDYTVSYLQTRKQFGRLIGSYQALKHPMVDAYVQYEQARSHLYAAAHCFDDQGAGAVATHMAKAAADAVLSHAADRSIQFHGGFGFTYDCDAQLYRRRAIYHAAAFGDAAWHRKKIGELLFARR